MRAFQRVRTRCRTHRVFASRIVMPGQSAAQVALGFAVEARRVGLDPLFLRVRTVFDPVSERLLVAAFVRVEFFNGVLLG